MAGNSPESMKTVGPVEGKARPFDDDEMRNSWGLPFRRCWVILHFEYMPDVYTRVCVYTLRVMLLVMLLVATAVFLLIDEREGDDVNRVLDSSWQHGHLEAALALLVILLGVSVLLVVRLWQCSKAGLKWVRVRLSLVRVNAAKAGLMMLVLIGAAVPSAALLATKCRVLKGVLVWFSFLRISATGGLLLVYVLQADFLLLRVQTSRYLQDGSLPTSTWWTHWPAISAYAMYEGLLLSLSLLFLQQSSYDLVGLEQLPDGGCRSTAKCSVPDAVPLLYDMVLVMLVALMGLVIVPLVRAWRLLKKRRYQDYRLAHLNLHVFMNFHFFVFLFSALILGMTLLVDFSDCHHFSKLVFSEHTSMLVMTLMTVADVLMTMPFSPGARLSWATVSLKSIAWTEPEVELQQQYLLGPEPLPPVPAKSAPPGAVVDPDIEQGDAKGAAEAASPVVRQGEVELLEVGRRGSCEEAGSACTGPSPRVSVDGEARLMPVFCMETAVKLLRWCGLVYNYSETKGVKKKGKKKKKKKSSLDALYDLDASMQLYGLKRHMLLWDSQREAKALLAWNEDTIVISFRGSAVAQNYIQDAKVVRKLYPGEEQGGICRSARPKVHLGFIKTWQGFDRVTRAMPSWGDSNTTTGRRVNRVQAKSGEVWEKNNQLVREVFCLLEAAPGGPGSVRVYITGHSLGGALAMIAAYELHRACELEPHQVFVYTFGGPRVGNRAWARRYERAVPHTWHVINGRDAVALTPNLFGAYKRAGRQCRISARGDLILQPTVLERMVLHSCTGKLKDHIRRNYYAAMKQVIMLEREMELEAAGQLLGNGESPRSLPQNRHLQKLDSLLGLLGDVMPVEEDAGEDEDDDTTDAYTEMEAASSSGPSTHLNGHPSWLPSPSSMSPADFSRMDSSMSRLDSVAIPE